ncbi:hypothetical protein OC834_002655 [Tilletia horrida]|nr:hypothetical protein OC834_002655 [Tilletia horrida]
MAQYELDSRDAFPLTLRFSKCSIVVPVHPATSVSELKEDIIAAIQAMTASGHVLNENSGWEQVGGRDPDSELERQHIGIFRGVPAAAAAGAAGDDRGNVPPGWEPPASFQRLDSEKAAASSSRGSSSSGPSVSSLGFRSGSDQVAYLGFAPKGSNTIARPVFATPAFLDEDEEEDEAGAAGANAAGRRDDDMDEGGDDDEEDDGEEGDEDDDAWKRAGVLLGGGSGPS